MKEKRYLYLTLGTISMIIAGIIYGWSILKMPLAKEFFWTPSQLAFNFTLTLSFFCVGGILTGIIAQKVGFKIMVVAGAVVSGMGFIFIAKTANPTITTLYFTYGIMAGSGIGMIYNSIITMVNTWFPDKKGLCSGVLMMGFGSSALIIGSIAGSIIENPALGWRTAYFLLGVSLIAVISISGLILKEAPYNDAGGAEGTDISTAGENIDVITDKIDYTAGEMVKSMAFVEFFLIIVAMTAVGATIISFAKDYMIYLGAGAVLSTTMVGVLSLFNGLGRILSGITFDIAGHGRTMIIATVITSLASGVTLISAILGYLSLGIIGIGLTGLSYGFVPTITAVFTRTLFGTKWFSSNFSIMTIALIPASFMATFAGKIYNVTNSYMIPISLLFLSSLVSLFLGINISKRK